MNNVILCYEMIPFAVLLNHAFPYHEFFTPNEGKPVAESVRQMMNVGDVLQDAYHSFTPSYQDYVVARESSDHHANTSGSKNSASPSKRDGKASPQKVIRTRTYLIGNLDKESMETTPELNGRYFSDSKNIQPASSDAMEAAESMEKKSLESGQVVHSEDLPDDDNLEDHHLGFDGEWVNNVVEVDLKSDGRNTQYADL